MTPAEREEKLLKYYQLAKSKGETEKAKKALNEIKTIRAASPIKGMSGFDKFRAGVGKAFADTGRGIGNLMGLVSDEDIRQANYRDKALMDDGYGMVGNMGGHAAQFALPGGALAGAGKALGSKGLLNLGTSLAAPKSVTTAAASGGLYGLLQPGDRLENATVGAIGGGLGQGIVSGAGRMLAPSIDDSARGLLNQDIPLTPGMILGGGAKKTEDALTSVPIVGSAIAKTQNDAVEGFNRAVWNKALEPIGKTLPDDIKIGRDAVSYVTNTISKAYDDVLPNLKGKIDDTLIGELKNISDMVQALTDDQIGQFNRIMDRSFYQHFTDFGLASGASLKRIESELGKKASKMRVSTDPKTSELGDALTEVLASLRRMMERQNPEQAEVLKSINTAYARMLRPERASIYKGKGEGVFTANNLDSAVKALEKNKRKYARGESIMQDISEPGLSVMGDTLNESGTAPRLMNAAMAGGGMMIDPVVAGSTIAGSATYASKPFQNMLRGLLTNRPQPVQQSGLLLKNNANIGAMLGAGSGVSGLLSY